MKVVKRKVYQVELRGLSGFSGNAFKKKRWGTRSEIKEGREYGKSRNKAAGSKVFSIRPTGKTKLRTYIRFGK